MKEILWSLFFWRSGIEQKETAEEAVKREDREWLHQTVEDHRRHMGEYHRWRWATGTPMDNRVFAGKK